MNGNRRQTIYFALAVIVLGGSAAAKAWKDFKIIKKPLPIRKPLIDMSPIELGPYELMSSERLSSDILSELGTDEYIQWTLRDKRIKNPRDALVNLFITYYTNVQDQVPHVPEECNPQAGLIPAGDDSLEFHLDSIGEDIAVRRLGFLPKKEVEAKNVVYYTINVNGSFHSGRQTARLRMGDPFDTHLYYSKVEIMFPGRETVDDPAIDRRATELMDAAVGILFRDHWPARGSERDGEPETASAATEPSPAHESE